MRRQLIFCILFFLCLPTIPLRAESPFAQISKGNAVSVDWSPDGQYIAYITFNFTEANQLTVVRVADRKVVFEQDGQFSRPRWSPDGTMLAVGGAALRVFDWPSQQSLLTLNIESSSPDTSAFVRNLDWSSRSHTLALMTDDGDLKIVSIPSGRITAQNTIHYGALSSNGLLDWSPDGQYLAAQSFSIDGSVSIWRADKAAASSLKMSLEHPTVDRIATALPEEVEDIAWNATSIELALAETGGLEIYSVKDGRYHDIDFDIENRSASSVAWSPDGSVLADSTLESGQASAELMSYLNFWNATNFDSIQKIDTTSSVGEINDMAWSSDSKRLALASYSGLWIYQVQ